MPANVKAPHFIHTLLHELSIDEATPTFSLEDAIKRTALDDEPHRHVHFEFQEEENNENQWENHRNCDCFMVNKVIIENGAPYGIVKVLKYLSKYIPDFFPISPSVNQKNIIFFILDPKQAKNIQLLCEPLINATVVFCRKYYLKKNIPTDITLKGIMVKRFNENDNSLNLNNLSNEKRLPPNLLTSVPGIFSLMKFIKRKYPHLNGISLKYNSLDNLQIVTSLAFICKSLKTLDVSYNKLNNINELEIVQICTKLDTIFLRHNPFSLKCLGLETYGRNVHRYLPNIKTLDDTDISSKSFYEKGFVPSVSSLFSSHIRNERIQSKHHTPIKVITID